MGTIRFLLALCVVATHSPGQAIAGVTLLSGITAVQAFYVISGFLITMVLNERKQYQSVGNFYLSRYLRLWPSYFVIAVASFLIYGKWLVPGLANMQWSTVMFIWFSNCTIFFQDLFFFLKFRDGFLVPATYWMAGQPPFVPYFLIVPQCWTLGVELTFYLIAPFVCRSPWRVAGLFLFGLGARLIIGALVVPGYDSWLYRSSPAEMTLFASGGLAYFGGKLIYSRLPVQFLALFSKIVLGLVMTNILANGASMNLWDFFFSRYSAYLYLADPAILIATALACPFLFQGFRKSRIDALLGEMSYPMYISHFLVATVLSNHHLLGIGNLLYVLVTLIVSVSLYLLIALPVDRLRSRFGARTPPAMKIPVSPMVNELEESPKGLAGGRGAAIWEAKA
jgi:peptidoglycan/LPS O-acetylase OafA/YrhL